MPLVRRPAVQLFTAADGDLTQHIFDAPFFSGDNVDDGVFSSGERIQLVHTVQR